MLTNTYAFTQEINIEQLMHIHSYLLQFINNVLY